MKHTSPQDKEISASLHNLKKSLLGMKNVIEIEVLNNMHKSREVHEKIKEITGGLEKSVR